MKIIAIGDLHGRDTWRQIVEKEKEADKFIFMGDYWDSFDVPFIEQLANWYNLVTFKAANPDKVVLLIGNHDFHYMWFAKEQYSGYQDSHYMVIRELLKDATNLWNMQMAYQEGEYLFTHAGVTNTWFDANRFGYILEEWTTAEIINYIFQDHPEAFRFTPSTGLDTYGDSITQSPIWVRSQSLIKDTLQGLTQVVGHTHMKVITYFSNTEDSHQIILTDTFDHGTEYLSIVDGVTSTKSLNGV